MNRFIIIITFFMFIFTGCSCSKNELIEENKELISQKEKLEEDSKQYEGLSDIFSWYNKITTQSVNSFVLIESKSHGNTLYTDGVVIASSGYNYYILGDYSKIKQDATTTYKVMDAHANVYDAKIATSNGNVVYDLNTGLVLFKVSVLRMSKVIMETIDIGEMDELSGHISSQEHINKIQICENIKTSTIVDNDTSYVGYTIDDSSLEGALINSNNQLFGLYSSNLNSFISKDLIENILKVNYSLVL